MEAHREDNLTRVQTAIGYVFNNPDWAWIAVQQAGSPVRAVGEHALPQGNKRLAGLGDRIIAMLIVDIAFAADPSIGDTNRRLSQFGTNDYLAAVCDQHGLSSCIIVNPAQNGVVHTNLKATTVEALLGAVYKDAGDDLHAAREVAKFLGIIRTPAS
ncbi:ribonuclease III [Colletotrichum somersetense]|nr:ribonuclease III [Colletotrichum somersetense]